MSFHNPSPGLHGHRQQLGAIQWWPCEARRSTDAQDLIPQTWGVLVNQFTQ